LTRSRVIVLSTPRIKTAVGGRFHKEEEVLMGEPPATTDENIHEEHEDSRRFFLRVPS
jgi:hypothetical protein